MLRHIFILILGISFGETWVNNARVENHADFYHKLIQETVLEVERREWCNLKLNDFTQTLNEQMYNWHVNGTVTYTNGFLVSIEKIDVTNIIASVNSRTIDGVSIPMATVRGRLNLRNVRVGFDVEADLVDEGVSRYTGMYTHILAQLELVLTQDVISKELTASSTILSLGAGSGVRMIYMPANNITEVLSRRYLPSSNYDSIGNWGRNIFAPIMLDISSNRIPFPKICFNC